MNFRRGRHEACRLRGARPIHHLAVDEDRYVAAHPPLVVQNVAAQFRIVPTGKTASSAARERRVRAAPSRVRTRPGATARQMRGEHATSRQGAPPDRVAIGREHRPRREGAHQHQQGRRRGRWRRSRRDGRRRDRSGPHGRRVSARSKRRRSPVRPDIRGAPASARKNDVGAHRDHSASASARPPARPERRGGDQTHPLGRIVLLDVLTAASAPERVPAPPRRRRSAPSHRAPRSRRAAVQMQACLRDPPPTRRPSRVTSRSGGALHGAAASAIALVPRGPGNAWGSADKATARRRRNHRGRDGQRRHHPLRPGPCRDRPSTGHEIDAGPHLQQQPHFQAQRHRQHRRDRGGHDQAGHRDRDQVGQHAVAEATEMMQGEQRRRPAGNQCGQERCRQVEDQTGGRRTALPARRAGPTGFRKPR